MTPDPKAIARGLSEAQRRSVKLFRWNRDRTLLHCPRYGDAGEMKRSLIKARICSQAGVMTKLGKQVRAILLEGNEND